MKLGGGKRTGVELSSRLHQVQTKHIPLVKNGASGTTFFLEVQGPSPFGSLTPTQPWLTQSSDPQRVAVRTACLAQEMLFIYLAMGGFQ